MEGLECLPDLGLSCSGIYYENHGILIFHLLHVLLSDQGVTEHHVEIKSLSLGEELFSKSTIVIGLMMPLPCIFGGSWES